MARAISDRTNVDAPSGNFTHGRVRNNDGSGNGTPNNEALHGDWIQFLEKLMRDNGITPNGNPDDQVNNQLFQGLLATIDNRFASTLQALTVAAFQALLTPIISSTQYTLTVNARTVYFDLGVSPTEEVGDIESSLPIGSVITFNSSTFIFVLNSTDTARPIKLQGNTTADDSYVVSGVFQLVRFANWWQLIEH